MPNDLKWTTTTYCSAHEQLEPVDQVLRVHPFPVLRWELDGQPTGRHGAEVRAITAGGCKVHFIGGATWLR